VIAPLARALAALDRPPGVLRPLLAVVVAVTGFAILEAHRMPAWATPDALGARLFHRTGGALHLLALGLGILFATASVSRVRRDGLLDHLHLAGATGLSLALALTLRSAAQAAALTALASPMIGVSLLYGVPVAVLASALSSALACAALGAIVGVAVASSGDDRSAPLRGALALLLLSLVGYRTLGQDAAAIALSPLRASPRGTLWFIDLLADGRASTAMRRSGLLAPWWTVLATAPWLLSCAAPGLSPLRESVRRPWVAALLSTVLITAPMAVAVHAVSRPLDRLAWLHAALLGWTALALALLDDELSLAIALLGTGLLALSGATGLPSAAWLSDSATVSASVSACVLVFAALISSLARRRSPRLVAALSVAALCVAPRVVRELAGSHGASAAADAFAGLSPLAAFELIARDAQSPGGAAWREPTRAAMATAGTLVTSLGSLGLVVTMYLRSKRFREIVR
jgi:hypothetical protein